MTWRELGAYVHGLSAQARIRTAINGGKPEPTGEQILLADVYDKLQHLNWTLQAANSTKEPKAPKPYARWWITAPKSKRDGIDRVARLDAARARRRERQQAITDGRIA